MLTERSLAVATRRFEGEGFCRVDRRLRFPLCNSRPAEFRYSLGSETRSYTSTRFSPGDRCWIDPKLVCPVVNQIVMQVPKRRQGHFLLV